MTPTPVGMRCPECASQRTRVVRNPTGTPSGFGAFPATVVLIAINVIVYLIEVVHGGGGASLEHQGRLRHGRPLGPGGERRRRLVADDHQRLRPRQHPPHRLQHVPAVHPRPAAGAVDRDAALRLPLLRLAAGGLVRRPLLAPNSVSAGASGAIFGVIGATFVIARGRKLDAIAGQIGILILINLVFTFADGSDQPRRPRRRPRRRRPLRPPDRRRRAGPLGRPAPATASRSSSARWPRSASSASCSRLAVA